MIARRLIALTALAAAAIAVGYALVPSEDEQVAMLIRDGHDKAALDRLQAQHDASQITAEGLVELYKLQSTAGDSVRAINALARYVALRPEDVAARASLVDLQGITQDVTGQIASLEQLVALKPDASRLRQLLHLYRLHGLFDREEQRLSEHARSGLLQPLDLERLGYMLARRGDTTRAIDALEIANRHGDGLGLSGREMLAGLLLDAGPAREALRHAVAWMGSSGDVNQLERLAVRFARTAGPEETVTLAFSNPSWADEAPYRITSRLVFHGLTSHATAVATRWSESLAAATPAVIGNFVSAVVQLQRPDLAVAALTRLAMKPTDRALPPSPVVEILADEIARQFGRRTLAGVSGSFAPHQLVPYPRLAARLYLADGNRMLAMQHLLQVDVAALPETLRSGWIDMLVELAGTRGAYARLSLMSGERKWPAPLFRSLASRIETPGSPQVVPAPVNSPAIRLN